MEAEWGTMRAGKVDLTTLVSAIHASAAPIGVKRVSCEFRRASLLRNEITYKYDQTDDHEAIETAYAGDVETAYVVIGVYPGESRDQIALVHLSFDGKQSRLRVESGSLRFLERLREQMA
ncbi:MAG: hypothetical protein AAFU49_08425 [Pseudomonadota bacterium]